MATVSDGTETAPPSPPPRSARGDVEFVQYERFIDAQLRKTRLQVKGVDFATSLLTLLVGSLAYLFLVALVDHWMIKGGLGFAGRLVFLLGFLAGAGAYCALALWPLLVRRINPVYAAEAIERSRPSLKNSLINFLLLRSQPGGLPPMVYDAVERQAADGLSQISVENAVDRSRLLQVGWALLAIVAICALYTVVSPKNPLRSFGRVVAPWADIAAPTRVLIADVTPGDVSAFHDQFVTVSAEISGVVSGEPVTLYYSTADGQLVDQAVAMSLPPSGLRYTAELPPTSGGLQQNVEYYLAAGDAVTQRYGIEVLITPSIVVERVEYEFPQYTEIDPRVADRQGDVKGLEGTRVTIHAVANDDIKAAYVDFDCDGRRDLTMQVDGRQAKATFTIGLKPKSDEPEHASYQLRFQNAAGGENPRPVRHQIDVIRDLPPRIAFVEPAEAAPKPVQRETAGRNPAANKKLAGMKLPAHEAAGETAEPPERQLPQGEAMRMAVEASDPDFKLASVKLMAQRNGQPLLSKELLPAATAGPFHGAFLFDTTNLKLAAGETVVYWAVAEDNKQPEPNRTETARYTLRITSPEPQQRKQDQLAKADQKQNQQKPNNRRDKQPNEQKQQGQPQQGEPQKGEGKKGEGQPQGDARRAQQQRDQQRRDQQPQEDHPAETQPNDGQQGEDNPGEQKTRGPKPDDPANSDPQPGENKDRGEGQQGEGKPGEGQKGEGKPGEGQQGVSKPGEKRPGSSGKPDQGSGGQDQRPVDPDAQPGDAVQKILDRRNQQQPKERGEQPANQPQVDKTKPAQQPAEKGNESSAEQKRPDHDPQGGEAQGAEAKDSAKPPQSGDKSSGSKSGEPKKSSSDEPGANSGSGAADKSSDQPQGASPADGKSNGTGSKNANPKNAQPKDGQPGEKPDVNKPDMNKPDMPPAGNNAAGDKKAGKKSTGEKTAGDKPPGSEETGSPATEQGPGKGTQQAADKAAADKGSDKGTNKPGEKQPGQQDLPKPGDGGKSGDRQPDDKQHKPHQDRTKPDEKKGGDAEAQNKGQAGAGEPGGNEKGSPSPQQDQTPSDKKLEPSGADKSDSQDKPESPSTSKKESDSKGGESGDRAGGGGKGGGQPSASQGTGSAGQNTAADEGSGRANTKGQGETGDKGGDQTKGKSKDGAGESSGERGPGDKSQPGGSNSGPGEGNKQDPKDRDPSAQQDGDPSPKKDEQRQPREKQPGDKRPGEKQSPGEQSRDEQQPQGQPDKAGSQPPSPQPQQGGNDKSSGTGNAGGAAGNPTGGGGLPPEKAPPPRDKAAPNEQGEDDANLEYSRKATDLALEYLKDQLNKENPDKKLLEELKWTREDAARFVAKWEKMKRESRAAGPQGEAARKQLDNALENLGLRPHGTALGGGQASESRTPTVRDTRRSEPPPEYRQQFRAYTKGVAKGAETDKPAANK